jgi:iron complex outermembrane recepter protein
MRVPIVLPIPLSIVFLLCLSSVQAQEAPPTRLPPVVIEGPRIVPELIPERLRNETEARDLLQRTPGGVSLVGTQEIRESRGANLKDVLDFVPGVLIRPRFGAADESQLSIRGSGLRNNFHLRGVNVLIDGFSYGNADGFSDFEALELLSTKWIEVYKGSNALRFGANTLGGAINLVTKTGYDASPLELRSEIGSFDFFKNHIATGHVIGPFDLYVGFTDTELNGFRDYSEQVRRRLYTSYGYHLDGGTTLRLDLHYVRNEENLPGALTREEFRTDPTQRNPDAAEADEARNYDYVRVAFTVRTPLTDTQAVEGQVQFNYQSLDHPLSFAIIDQETDNWGAELRYLQTSPLLGHGNRLTVGVQFAGTWQSDRNFANVRGERGALTKDQRNEAINVGAYLEEQFDLARTLTLVLGGRVDYAWRSVSDDFFTDGPDDINPDDSDSVDFVSTSPKVGFVWHVTPTVQFFGNASRSYEPPLLLELTAPGQLQGDLSQLEAQKAWQFEVGTRGSWKEWWSWDVAVYDIELWDEIRNVNVQPFPGAPFTIPRFENIERSRHTGVEVGSEVRLVKNLAPRLGLGQMGDTLALRTAYTWSRFVFVDDATFDHNDLPGAPEHFVRGELRYRHQAGFWIAPNVEAVPTGYFVNSENTERTDPYTLVNIRLGYDYRPWKLSVFFEGRNLTDEVYASAVQVDSDTGRFFEPGDGRAFYGGVSWQWH